MTAAAPGALHGDAVRVLSGWPAPGGDQERLRAGYLAHLGAHADGMWRENRLGHVTASALVVAPGRGPRGEVLLTLHRKLGMWLQMGGHCEPGDATLAGAALREATEESGIAGLALTPEPVNLDRHSVPCHGRDVPRTDHLDVQYAALAPAGATPVISDESADLRWFPADALPSEVDGSVRRLVAAALAAVG